MAGRMVMGVLFIVAGALHFVLAKVYLGIMPPLLPAPLLLVYVSGAFEVLGGVGLLVPATQRFAAWGLIALLVAVWPANVYMATIPEHFPSIPGWALWARVPLQIPLIWWAWQYARR